MSFTSLDVGLSGAFGWKNSRGIQWVSPPPHPRGWSFSIAMPRSSSLPAFACDVVGFKFTSSTEANSCRIQDYEYLHVLHGLAFLCALSYRNDSFFEAEAKHLSMLYCCVITCAVHLGGGEGLTKIG